MARQPRLVLPGEPHLLGQRGLNGESIARDATDAQAWLSIVRDVAVTRRIALHAFSLRPKEFRLLVSPPDHEACARLLQDVGRRYVAPFNLRHGRSGSLWAGRFRCAAIARGQAELLAMAWVEAEEDTVPLLSSAAHHTGLILDPGIGDPPSYWALGNTPFDRQAAWRERLAQGISTSQAARLERALRTGIPMADEATLQRLQPQSPLRLIPRPRGRPRSRPPL